MVTVKEADGVIKRILEKLIAVYQPQKVILFGSYAYGTPGPGSDIDLLVVKDTSDRFVDRCFAARRAVSSPSRKIALEILVLTPEEVSKQLTIGDQFIGEIINKGQVLYAA